MISFAPNDIILEAKMGQLVVRKLDDEVKEQLRRRAKLNGRSLEAEAREILERSVKKAPSRASAKTGLGTELAERMKDIGVRKKDVEELERNIAELRKRWRARDVFSEE